MKKHKQITYKLFLEGDVPESELLNLGNLLDGYAFYHHDIILDEKNHIFIIKFFDTFENKINDEYKKYISLTIHNVLSFSMYYPKKFKNDFENNNLYTGGECGLHFKSKNTILIESLLPHYYLCKLKLTIQRIQISLEEYYINNGGDQSGQR